jgi:pyridoxal phosphate enzyme (YggS family)
MPPLNICIQINSSEETTKSGVEFDAVNTLANEISKLSTLKLRGLMAIPAPTTDLVKQHEQFKIVNDVFAELQHQGFALDTLSIGMSNDYMVAIQEGATIVRVGSAIFGVRTKQ